MGWFTFPAEQSALAAFPPGCSVIRMVQCQEKKITNNADNDNKSKSSSKSNDNDNDNDGDPKVSASRDAAATPSVTCHPSKSNSSTYDASAQDIGTRMEIQVGRIKAVGVNLMKNCTREMMYKFEQIEFPANHHKNESDKKNENDESKEDDDDLDRSNWVPESELQFAPYCPVWFTSMESSRRGEETRRSAQVLGSYHAPDASNNDVLYSIKVYGTSRNTNSNSSPSASPSFSSSSSSSNNDIIHHGVTGSQIIFRTKTTTSAINTNINHMSPPRTSSPRTNSMRSTSRTSIPSQEHLPTQAASFLPPPPPTHHTLTSQPLVPLVQQSPLPPPPPPPQRIRLLQLPLWIDYQVVRELISEGFKEESQYITFVPPHHSVHKDCPCPEFPHVRFTGIQASQDIVDKFGSFLRLTLQEETSRTKYNNETRIWEHPVSVQQQRPQQYAIPPPPTTSTAALPTQYLPTSFQQPPPQPQHLPTVLPSTTQTLRSSPVLLIPTPLNNIPHNGEEGGSDGCSSITEPEPPLLQDRKYTAVPISTSTEGHAKRRRSDDPLQTTNHTTTHPNRLGPIVSDKEESLESNSSHKRRRVWPYYNPNSKTTKPDKLMTLQMIPDWFPSKMKAFEVLSKKRGNSGSWISLIYGRTGCTVTVNASKRSSSSNKKTTAETTTPSIVKLPKVDIVITGPNDEQLQHAEELMDDRILQIFCRRIHPKVLFGLAANRQRRNLPKEGDDDHELEKLSFKPNNDDGLLYQRFRTQGEYRKEWMRLVSLPNVKSGGAVIGKRGERIGSLRKKFAGTHIIIETEGVSQPFILLAGSDKSQVLAATRVVTNIIKNFGKLDAANARKSKERSAEKMKESFTSSSNSPPSSSTTTAA